MDMLLISDIEYEHVTKTNEVSTERTKHVIDA